MMRSLLVALLATLGSVSMASAQAVPASPDSPIATVSWGAVAQKSAVGQRVFRRLLDRERDWMQKLDPEREGLIRQQQQVAGLPERDDKVRAFRRAQVSFERRQEDAKAELVNLQGQVEAEFRAMVAPALEALVKERRILMVLEREAPVILWAAPVVDLSEALAERIDQQKQ